MQSYPKAVVLLVERDDGLILAVSRKNDHTLFGLPGGKVEPGEDPSDAVRREVFEETGVRIMCPLPFFSRVCFGETPYEAVTYYEAFPSAFLFQPTPFVNSEGALVDWVTREKLYAGPFGRYMKQLFNKLRLLAYKRTGRNASANHKHRAAQRSDAGWGCKAPNSNVR